MSSGRSPTTHEEVRSRLSASAAARAIPGIGLRSSLVRGELGHTPVRVVRAVEESVDVGAVLCEPLGDVAVDLFHVTDVVEPSGDTSLVGHDRHRHPGPVESGDRFGGAVNELDAVDRTRRSRDRR